MSRFYIVMGVSGCGKSTVGAALANISKAPFYDADDFHPEENVQKMASGNPLNDEDRAPWLGRLHTLIAEHVERDETAVLACSALKKKYRDQLRGPLQPDQVQFIHLDGSFELIWSRMQARKNHYMKADMLQSQFDTLEAPQSDEALIINVSNPLEDILKSIMANR